MRALNLLASLVLCLSMSSSFGQARPVRLMVPFPAGGPSDAVARALAQGLASGSGPQLTVENRAGAGGSIAAQAVLGAAPDGQTLLWGVASMAAIPLLQKSPPFQSLHDMTPVSLVGRFAYALVSHPTVPARTVAELARHAKANPGKLSYATGTLGEFLTATLFMKTTGTEMVRVPYKGGVQAMPDLVAGRVQLFFTPVQLGLPYAKEGKLRLLTTLAPSRIPLAPDVPTIAESGYPSVITPTWQAVFAPPKTSRDVALRLASEIAQALKQPETRSRLDAQAFIVDGMMPEALSSAITEDFKLWQSFVRDHEIPFE